MKKVMMLIAATIMLAACQTAQGVADGVTNVAHGIVGDVQAGVATVVGN